MNGVKSAIVLVISTVFILGLVMIYGTSSAEALEMSVEKQTYFSLVKQLVFAVSAIFVGWATYRLGYLDFLSLSPSLLGLFTFLLLLVLIPGVGKEINGSKRWLSLAGVSFQPSEFVKYLIPSYVICRLTSRQKNFLTFRAFLWILFPLFLPLALISLEPNNGTVFVIGVTLAVVLFLTRVRAVYWALPLLVIALLTGALAYQLPYVSGRIQVFLNPELDLRGRGHQPHQAKIAAGSGGLFGKGPGKSWQKLSYLPEAQNDYIAAIYAEEFGFFGIFLLTVLFAIFSLCGFVIAYQAPSLSAQVLGGTITFLIVFQAFVNLGVVGGILPCTGLNLPFFSRGGTSLLANVSGLALLFSLDKGEG